jgi:effector-binding domain-containing protein
MTMIENIRIEELPAEQAAVVHGRCLPEEIGDFVGAAFGEVLAVLGEQGLTPTGPPLCRYSTGEGGMDQDGAAVVFTLAAGFPSSGPVEPAGRVEPMTLPAGSAVTLMHVGAYTGLGEAYAAAARWMDEQGLEGDGDPWETYLDEPDVPAPRTRLSFPCRERP